MYRTMIPALCALALSVCFIAPAAAEAEAEMEVEPPANAESETSDADFAKSLIGKNYDGEFEIEGWMDFGGGLVAPPIYVHHYQREDGTSLVVTSKETSGTNLVVIDALIISKPWKGYVISIACTKGEDFALRFIGDARGPDSKEWWTEVRRAWEIAVEIEAEPETETDSETSETGNETETDTATEAEAESEPQIEPGKITETNTRGVKCANPDW
jgi:hypothetical protein